MESTQIENTVIKFAGDSGDGMQLVGSLFTDTVANQGYEIATFPDFPSEIRAPQGTVAGVSGFQIHYGTTGVHSPGDKPDVLVAMNPAALKANFHVLKSGATVIVDIDSFRKRDLDKSGFNSDPFEDEVFESCQVIHAPITSMTKESVKELGLDNKSAVRCKNMFTLGIIYWLFNESPDAAIEFFLTKFRKKPELAQANILALKSGLNFAQNIEAIRSTYTILPAKKRKGLYKNITGNQAVAWGLMAAAQKSEKDLFLGTYPITPATDILHELTKHKWKGVKIFQAEDEIAGICSAIGASFAGDIAVTTTSGPGMALKTEAIGLAIMSELPLVIVNVQRGGPSTGLPTKTEQSDLNQALSGRNGESPIVVLAASTPGDCFEWAFEAVRVAVEHMTPVILLTESYLGNGAEPWHVKNIASLPDITPPVSVENGADWKPYLRDEEKLNRKWIAVGTEGYAHRIGGLEKQNITGDVSHDPENHELMVNTRAEKVARVSNYIPLQRYKGKDAKKLLVIGWGGQFGILFGAVEEMQMEGFDIAFTNFNYINPLPRNSAEVFSKFERLIVCELNKGQFADHLAKTFPQFNFERFNKVKGQPFTITELKTRFTDLLKD